MSKSSSGLGFVGYLVHKQLVEAHFSREAETFSTTSLISQLQLHCAAALQLEKAEISSALTVFRQTESSGGLPTVSAAVTRGSVITGFPGRR